MNTYSHNTTSTVGASPDKSSFFQLIFFFFWPVFSFFYAMLQIHTRWARVTIVLFYGLCSYFYPFSMDDDIDVVRHAERFGAVVKLPFSGFLERFGTLYVSDSYKPDLLQSFIEFTVSRVTTDYRLYFVVMGLVMGFTIMQLNRQVKPRADSYPSVFAIIFLVYIFLLIPPYRIGAFRQMTGMFIFCIGAYRVLVFKENRYNFLVLSSALAHFSFLVILPFYFLVLFNRTRFWVYYVLIVAGYFLQDQAHLFIGDWGSELQGQLGSRLRGYTSERYIELIGVIKRNRNILIDNQIRWTSYALFATIFIFMRKTITRCSEETRLLYALVLSVFAFTSFASNLETTFVRFSLLHIVLSLILCYRVITYEGFHPTPVFKLLVWLTFAFNLVIMTRKALDYTGVQILSPNLIGMFFIDTNESVWSFITSLR